MEVPEDPNAYLSVFTDTQKGYAAAHNLDLESEAGRILAAVLKWPTQYTLASGNECTFTRAYEVCHQVHDIGGLCGDDFTDPRRLAAATFDDTLKAMLMEASKPLKPAELRRLACGLDALCNGGGGGEPGSKKPRRSSTRARASTAVTERIQEDFKEDFIVAGLFDSIEVCRTSMNVHHARPYVSEVQLKSLPFVWHCCESQ